MPNRLFQGIINQMRDATDRIIGVVDESGTVISCSELGLIGEIRKGVIAAGVFNGAQICVDSCTYKAFGDSVHPEYAVFVDGTDEMSRHFADIIAVALDQIKKNNDEKFDRSNFVKNVILDNILPGDIYIKSRELRFNNDATRVVFLIRVTKSNDVSSPTRQRILSSTSTKPILHLSKRFARMLTARTLKSLHSQSATHFQPSFIATQSSASAHALQA